MLDDVLTEDHREMVIVLLNVFNKVNFVGALFLSSKRTAHGELINCITFIDHNYHVVKTKKNTLIGLKPAHRRNRNRSLKSGLIVNALRVGLILNIHYGK